MEQRTQIKEYLLTGLEQLGLEAAVLDLDRQIEYFECLLQANETLNLISPKQDLQTRVAVHLLDSLTPLLWPDWPPVLTAMDLGSGGGLPAIPLSLAFPGWTMSLVEATGKKTSFLATVKEKLKLDQIGIINKFLEPDKNPEGQTYELISARGVSHLKQLAAIAGPRLKPGGRLLAFKGPRAAEEMLEAKPQLKKWRLQLDQKMEFRLPLVGAERTLLRLVKT